MPLVEITVSTGVFTSEEKLRLAKAVEKGLQDEIRLLGKNLRSWVFVREVDRDTFLASRTDE